MALQDKYDTVVGLEVHAQLSTKSKIFCADNTSFGAEPNTQVSPVSLAHPGTLPVLNKEAIRLAVKLGLALNCRINPHFYFERKNYFYPDLPKGYQVTQQASPVCLGGLINVLADGKEKKIQLNRIHMEEDAGKSLHDESDYTSIDLNRAGVPLVEIVTEPDLSSGEEAYAFLTELRKIVRWIEVCDGNMEEGSMRCDANISVKPKGSAQLGTRVEIKNLNSIRNVKKAIEIESLRLMELHEKGEVIIQETRSFDAGNNSTFSLRLKEDAEDYRYFPEPDLSAFHLSDEYISEQRSSIKDHPITAREKLTKEFNLSEYDAALLTVEKSIYHYYLKTAEITSLHKATANWINGPVRSYCNENNIMQENFPLSPEKLSELILLADKGLVHFNAASTRLMQALTADPSVDAKDVATKLNILQQSDNNAIEEWIDKVLAEMPDKVQEYKKGKKALLGMFAGEVKKQSKGRADMQLVMQLLNKKLS